MEFVQLLSKEKAYITIPRANMVRSVSVEIILLPLYFLRGYGSTLPTVGSPKIDTFLEFPLEAESARRTIPFESVIIPR